MSSQVTLGGERVGSGKKMKVNLHGYERTTVNMSHVWRSTMACGTLVPFMCEVGLPGDTFDIDLEGKCNTMPTVGPLFGSFKKQYDVFMIPMRLYNAALHNNMLGIGLKMNQVYLPTLELEAKAFEFAELATSHLLRYLGISGIGRNSSSLAASREFNAIPLMGYWDIYKNYYAHKSEEEGVVVAGVPRQKEVVKSILIDGRFPNALNFGSIVILEVTDWQPGRIEIELISGGVPVINTISPTTAFQNVTQLPNGNFRVSQYWGWSNVGLVDAWNYNVNDYVEVVQEPLLERFDLKSIDDMRLRMLAHPISSPFSVNSYPVAPYNYAFNTNGRTCDQQGLGIKTYQSDMFNNWLNSETIDGPSGINELTKVAVVNDAFTVDALRLANKVNEMLNRIAVSGGTYDDYLTATYDQDQWGKPYIPVYVGGMSEEILFSEVVSTAESTEPLGTLAGKGYSQKRKGGRMVVRCTEPCYIMGIVSITPRIDYSQGNKWDVHLKNMAELHVPALDEIGFQDLMLEKAAYFSTVWEEGSTKWEEVSAGKQPAWLDYMTNVNRTFGNFANDEQRFMTLNRQFEPNDLGGGIKDFTAYIDPKKFNYIFADARRDAQNFWVQIAINMEVRRKMSAKLMPNL